MEIKKFAEKVQKAVALVLGEEYQVRLQEVQKNNGVLLQGLIILRKKQNVSPTIYLQPFWEAYEAGVTLLEVVNRIIQIYREDMPADNIDMTFFKSFEKVRDRICYRLIHAERNKELLQRIPYVPFLDLAICFYYAYEGEVLGNGSILIHNSHLKMWNTNIAELMYCAKCNTPKLFPWECGSMELTVRALKRELDSNEEEYHDILEDEKAKYKEELPMYIVTNRQKVHGAACILYPDLLTRIGEGMDANFYILPSSVHEVILLTDSGNESARQLQEMIEEVNRTQVEPEEVLSDSLYYFDREAKQVKIV